LDEAIAAIADLAQADAGAATTSGKPEAPAAAMPSEIVQAIASAALDAALPKSVRKRLAAGRPIAIVIGVPSPQWLEPIGAAVGALSPTAFVLERDGGKKAKKPDAGDDEVAAALVYGRPVIGASPAPDRALPAALNACADVRVDIAPINETIVRGLLRRFARGRAPRNLSAAPCASLSIAEIVSCFRRGSTAREVLAGFTRLAARKSATSALDDTPSLERLPGFSGAARAWGEDLVVNFGRWRAGEVAWRSLSASAVLAGPPGTGKTLFAKSLARSLGVALHVTSVGDWFAHSDGCLGGVTQALESAWNAALADARGGGALLLIDELDALPDRATMGPRAREWWATLIAHALTLFDGAVTARDGLVLMGATNFAAHIDAALVRPGRFDRVIEIPPPSVENLVAVLNFHLDGALAGADLKPLVQLAGGATPAAAAGWARQAKAIAAAERREVALGDLVAVIAPPDERPAADIRRIAIHEAGHVVVASSLGRAVESVTLVPAGVVAGQTVVDAVGSIVPTARELERGAMVSLAGRAAEQIVLGAPSAAAEGDLARATAAVASAQASSGLGRSLVHVVPTDGVLALIGRDPALRRAVHRRLERLYSQVVRRVARRRAAVERVADALAQRRFLAGDELKALVAPRRQVRQETGRRGRASR
jgi:hypothetical protein